MKKGKLPRGAYKQAAEKLNMNPRTLGPTQIYSTDRVQRLVQAVHAGQCSTFRDMAEATGLTLGTLTLMDANSDERTAFCHSLAGLLEDLELWDVLHLDEKWFDADKDRRKIYLVPGEMQPRRSGKSKRFIHKVMFLGPVARPRYDETRGVFFDGKIGMLPFVRLVSATRNSRN
ncbi:hypothetical protein H257_16015 [Aphanomyces astaci]|uniref:Uncharacterized protein n=1 Tax=Aphanomyces astaci TaxID=112090 RepID=W4FK75_APHAT|nr:hypothetical protein H257_16015 [Aphanomyces astaci]ETV67890.1 hypothetical protein H257_16015 [Aphanomyces astaci]|eukprot:XP_009842635.1 hypothetical protein H257_16015 [Aphanomyces astaci]